MSQAYIRASKQQTGAHRKDAPHKTNKMAHSAKMSDAEVIKIAKKLEIALQKIEDCLLMVDCDTNEYRQLADIANRIEIFTNNKL